MTAAGGAPIERDDLVRLAVAVVLHDRAGARALRPGPRR